MTPVLQCVLLLACLGCVSAGFKTCFKKDDICDNKLLTCEDNGSGKGVPLSRTQEEANTASITACNAAPHTQSSEAVTADSLVCYAECPHKHSDRVGCFKTTSTTDADLWAPAVRSTTSSDAVKKALYASTTKCAKK